jgi:hypothetical protein
VFAVLRALPIPVIGVPWFQIQHLPEMLVVAHEVGHDIQSDFKLTKDIAQALNQAMDTAATDSTHRPAWHARSGEIFADIYGVLSCGPAFVEALIDFLATDPDKTMGAVRTAPKRGLYPTDYLRVLINIEALDPKDFATERTQLRDQWTAVYTKHPMPDYEKDIPVVVKAIIDGPYAAFGGSSLKKLIFFRRLISTTLWTTLNDCTEKQDHRRRTSARSSPRHAPRLREIRRNTGRSICIG